MSPLVLRLNREWEYLATAAATRSALRRWGRVEPPLAEFTDLHQVLAAVHRPPVPERADVLLGCLVRLAAGDGRDSLLAARVVLQLLLPGMVALARGLAGRTGRVDTELEYVIAEITIGVRTYPCGRRPRQVAANLLLDARQRITRRRRRDQRELPVGLDAAEWMHPWSHDSYPAVELRDLFVWAVARRGVISWWEARLIVESRLGRWSTEQLTDRFGCGRSSLFARRRAAESRLRVLLENEGWRG